MRQLKLFTGKFLTPTPMGYRECYSIDFWADLQAKDIYYCPNRYRRKKKH